MAQAHNNRSERHSRGNLIEGKGSAIEVIDIFSIKMSQRTLLMLVY